MSDQGIQLGRLSKCTFEQALELRQRGFEGYHDRMAQYFPNFIRPPASPPPEGALDRLLDGFGTQGIRPELSIVGYADGKPVGFVFLAVKIVDGMKLAWNGGTGVFPEYRGRGIARAMMQEAERVIAEQDVDRAVLEVVVSNEHAIAAYRKGGFQIADRLIGMTRTEPLEAPFYDGEPPAEIELKFGAPKDVARLSFYRDKAAWGCMWHTMKTGESLIAYDGAGEPIAYALFQRVINKDGELQSCTLRQCEVSPERQDKETLIRLLLSEVYGRYDAACTRKTGDLSMANPETIDLLKSAGFTTNYEQYLMLREKNSV